MRLTEVRIAGFGGQGVILAATIIGKAASIFHGGYATMTQSFGPEARGGACSAQLVISPEPVLYPYVTQPDVLVALSQEAYSRFAREVRPNGTILIEQDLVRRETLPQPVKTFGIPATRLAEEIGKRMILNVVTVGFFAGITQLLPKEAFEAAVADSVPPHLTEINLQAFRRGYDFALSGEGVMKELPTLDEHHAILES